MLKVWEAQATMVPIKVSHKDRKGGMLIEILDLFRLEVWTSSWEWMR